jgi:hypothetical protein
MPAEYAVVSRREHMRSKRVLYQTREGADRRLALLIHPRPWEALGQDPDAYVCCAGIECGCGGNTVREGHEAMRSRMPALLYARIEVRQVGAWEWARIGGGVDADHG